MVGDGNVVEIVSVSDVDTDTLLSVTGEGVATEFVVAEDSPLPLNAVTAYETVVPSGAFESVKDVTSAAVSFICV